ncbi:MAG: SRPBCC domain-containing protein [Acidobacteriota bacterium]
MAERDERGSLPDHVLSIEIAASVEDVWAEITKTGRIQRAMYNTVLESDLKPGAKLRYYSPDKKRVFIVGEVKEVEAPRRLVHTYMMTMKPEAPTLVTWELEEIDSGCRITLTHSDWTTQTNHEKVAKGWGEIFGMLKSELETGDISLGWKIMYGIMSFTMFMLPKTTKVEEVDRQGW